MIKFVGKLSFSEVHQELPNSNNKNNNNNNNINKIVIIVIKKIIIIIIIKKIKSAEWMIYRNNGHREITR